MKVNPGYKQTGVGVIPEDWDAGSLGRFWGVIDCKHVTAQFVPQGYPLASITEVQSRFVDLTNAKQTTAYFYNLLIEGGRKPRGGDLILSRNATVGEVAQVADWHPPFAMGQDVCLLRKKSSEHSTEFLQAVFQSSVILNQLADLMVGSTFKRANIQQIRNFAVPMPSPREQRAIAQALGDVDGLLGGLDRLIAKKRGLKQAAMQQLLTGQTRLPGFHGEWGAKKLKQVAEISTGINKPLSEMGSGALYVTVHDLYDKTSIRTERLSRIRVSPSEIEARSLAVGDIVFGKSSVKRDGIGYPSQFLGCGEPVVFSGFTYRARARQGIADAAFLFYALREEKTRRWLIDNSQASALTNINQAIADAIPVNVPPTVPEQTAIVEVLTGMDAELSALEQRQEKTLALKQAMMQELLTGKIRLVPPQVTVAEKPDHNWQINEAVIIGALALQFGTEAWPLPRKRRVKLTYLLHRHAEGKAEGYLKKAAGPYNPKTKYQGPEGIALKNGYVREHNNGKYSGFVAAGKISQAEQYFAEWYPRGREWVEQFRFSKTDDLEVLATVDMAIEDLKSSNRAVSLKGVKEVIRAHPEWEAKLTRSAFSDANIAEAMNKCNELFMSSTPDI